VLYPARGPADQPVVGHWHNVRRDLAQACDRARIERVSPNDLRRTFASWLKQAECDSLAVAKLLGHTSSRMVELVYGHLDQRALEQAVARLPIRSRRRVPPTKPLSKRGSERRTLH
jgi:integrase